MKKLIYSKEDLDLILSIELEEKDKEIERLNNIINELEKWLKFAINSDDTEFFKGAWSDTLRKLQELKDSDKE